MNKKILVTVLILLLVIAVGLSTTKAFLNDTSTIRISIDAASLDFKLNGDDDSSLELNLGEITPGDSGRVDLIVNNQGSIPGSLCVTTENIPPEFVVWSSSVCDIVIEPGDSTQFTVDWILPIETHNTGLSGEFNFSFTFVLTNGYRITKNVILKGTIFDPTDTPTMTPTETITSMPTVTETPDPTPTETSTPTLTSTPTVTNTPIESPTPTATVAPTETSIPTLTSTPTATNTATETSVETQTPEATNTPTSDETSIP